VVSLDQSLDPLSPHRVDFQIKTLRTLANRLESEMLRQLREHDVWRTVQYGPASQMPYVEGFPNEPMHVVYADDDYLALRSSLSSMIHIFEKTIRADAGGKVRLLFSFDCADHAGDKEA
jgi:hypothetical protein